MHCGHWRTDEYRIQQAHSQLLRLRLAMTIHYAIGRSRSHDWSPHDHPDRPASSIDPKLLEILVCPLTKSTLEYDAEKQELISRAAKLAYPIRDGIPIMLPEEARRLD